MKILFITFGPQIIPSSRTRVYQYLPFFKKDNISYKVINNFNSIPYLLTNYLNSNRFNIQFDIIQKIIHLILSGLVIFSNVFNIIFSMAQIVKITLLIFFGKYDVLFIQKVFFPLFLIKIFKYHTKMLVFDFDDAIYTQSGYFRNQMQFNRLVSFYDLIVLENDDSYSYVTELGYTNILMITGPIDTDRYYPKKKYNKKSVVIGWIGGPSTQKYIYLISNVLKKLSNKYNNVIFETIGAGHLNIKNIRISKKDWNFDTEVDNLTNFDIGIMPLPDDAWTRGKGGYKLLQYMAMGIPCCASPVGINKKLIVDGFNGFLLDSEQDWLDKLAYLIENEKIRKKMGNNGRNMALNKYSFHSYYPILKKYLWDGLAIFH